MTDSLKFGPDWLRSMACTGDGYTASGGGGNSNLTTPKYQLAEHRYGREEMLALFDRNLKPPEPLVTFAGLYVPKVQLPLALIQMTEEEQRSWNTGVTANVGRGRGGSIDRGGRTIRPGRGGAHFRGGGFDEIGDSPRIETQPFPARTRAFDRPQNERGWAERNGVETVEWNGSTSPRKELSRGASGSSLMESNWRRSRAGGEDEDGWRTNARGEKWGKSSWRDTDKDRGERPDGDDDKRGERWDHKGSNRAFDPHPPLLRRNRSNHHDNHDNLPEWAVENPSESGGSFDATGAFHGQFSDDDDDYAHDRTRNRGARMRRVSEGNSPHTKSSGIAKSPSSNSMIRPQKTERTINGDRPKSLHGSDTRDLDRESRRSLSPIKSSPVPNSPAVKKASSAASSASTDGNSASSAGAKIGVISAVDVKKKDKGAKSAMQDKSKDTATAAVGNNAAAAKTKTKMDNLKKSDEAKSKTDRNKVVIGKPDDIDKSDHEKTKTETLRQVSQAPPNHQQRQLQEQQATSIDKSVIDQEDKKREADHLGRIEEEVAKLIEGVNMRDEKPPGVLSAASGVNKTVIESSGANVSQSTNVVHEKWFYRDPQGEVQGPFLASEMAEWHKQGYFAPNLLVRRTCDERYTTLGELVSLCGTVPFKPGTLLPPLKLVVDPMMASAPPTGLPSVNPSISKPPAMEDSLFLYQLQQYRQQYFIQNQFLKQLRTNAIAKLSQTEQWPSLTLVEQNQLVLQYMRTVYPEMNDFTQPQPSIVPNTFMPSMSQTAAPPSNAVLQLFPQLQGQVTKSQAEQSHVTASAPSPHVSNSPSGAADSFQQFMQQMSGIRNLPPIPPQAAMLSGPPPTIPQPTQEDNAVKSWLRQLGVTANGLQQQQPPSLTQQPPQIDSVWHQPPPHLPTFNAQNWMSQVGAIQPTIPPGQISGSLWDIHPKEMKTEQQILEEQNLKIQEEKKKEDLRKKEELERQQAEERAKRKQEEELARLKAAEEKVKREEERKNKEEEKKRREEEKKRREEEKQRQEEEQRKLEEKKREEKRKHDEEVNRKKQEEEKKRRDEMRRQEEKLKKEEEKRRKLEEEQRRQEEERLRKEEEARKKAEAEEQARKAEQRRREAEALRKLQERSKAPWAQAPPAPPPTAQASFAEIQRLEREQKAEEQRLLQILQQQQIAQQKAAEAQQEALTDSAKRLQFKWAEKVGASANANQVKSLEQIQQEEQEKVAKTRQQEREKLEKEKAAAKENAVNLQNISIWGGASHSLSWSNAANTGGFWDEPVPKTVSKSAVVTAKPVAPRQPVQAVAVKPNVQQQQMQQSQLQQQNNKVTKSKSKKDEEVVKKLFEQNTAKTDDFTQWCNKALTGLKVSVDIPTFISFLRDVESPFEVKEYVRMYLGETKQSCEFAKQFLEKRSKWKSSQRPQTQADDLCKPAPAINPNVSTEFQEVKSKSKKPKKGKMFKVDSKMLGFSVMSAADRINVGDRDYAEGI